MPRKSIVKRASILSEIKGLRRKKRRTWFDALPKPLQDELLDVRRAVQGGEVACSRRLLLEHIERNRQPLGISLTAFQIFLNGKDKP